MKTKLYVAAFSLVVTSCVSAQGTFGNLNFESANPIPLVGSPYYPYAVASSNGIPSWTAYIGANAVDWLLLNTVSLGAAAISLQGPGSGYPILQGSYSVFLQPQFGTGIPVPALAQTGLIPATAKSIRFYTDGLISVSFAGQDIPVAIIGSGSGYSIFGGDISALANLTGELRFQGGGTLDNIFFSNQPIPEPSALALFGLGALLFGYRSCRVPKS
jgi:hypothetical protein